MLTEGFIDWKNAAVCLSEHESLDSHKKAMSHFVHRRNTDSCQIDSAITQLIQFNSECEYWRSAVDPFLKEHIVRHGNAGQITPSYHPQILV